MTRQEAVNELLDLMGYVRIDLEINGKEVAAWAAHKLAVDALDIWMSIEEEDA